MNPLSWIIFLLFLLAIFIFEALGLRNGREIAYYLLLLMPAFLFFVDRVRKKGAHVHKQKFQLPQKLTVLFLIFLLFSAISTAFSVSVIASFRELLVYLSLFLIFAYVINHKADLKNLIVPSIFALAYFFSLYSLVLKKWSSILIYSSYNLVTPGGRSHNLLGNFLVLPILISFYKLQTAKGNDRKSKERLFFLASILFFMPFFVLSYSRSAYLTLILSLCLLGFYFVRQKKIKFFSRSVFSGLAVLLLTVVLFLSTVDEAKKIPILSFVNKELLQSFDLKYKTFFARRGAFFSNAISSIKLRPFFGLGPGNYYFGSQRFSSVINDRTTTSHNLFLEIFSENGVLVGIVFVLIVYLLFVNSRMDVFKLTFLALFLNFQTDYTYRLFPLILLFFILAGMIYKEKAQIKGKSLIIVLTIILLIFIDLIFLSKIMLKRRSYKAAFYLYPLNSSVYKPLIELNLGKGDYQKLDFYLSLYGNLSKGPYVSEYIANTYLIIDDKKNALFSLKRAYLWDPFNPGGRFRRIYDLEEEVYGEEAAMRFVNSHLTMVEKIKAKDWWSQGIINEAETFCQEIYEKCPYIFVK